MTLVSARFHVDNKRLDEWVSEDRLDIERLQLPSKDSKSSTANVVATMKNLSRAASPDVITLVPPSLLPPEPIRRSSIVGRKRKLDVEVLYNMYV